MRVRVFFLGIVFAIPMFVAAPVAAQEAVQVRTPYPAVAVEAGESVTFDIEVVAGSAQAVDLRVAQRPEGWTTTLRGGGFVIDGVFAQPNEPPSVQLEVEVPAEAREGDYTIQLVGDGSGGQSTLPLRLRVAEAVAGGVELQGEHPLLRGAADTTFTFDLNLANNTPEEIGFKLEATGPEGWTVEARPSVEQQAVIATVAGGETTGVQVEVDPPDDVEAGTYPVQVSATGGGQDASTELQVEITGNYAMTLTTPDERLNVDVTSGGTARLPMVVRNDGTAPLQGVTLTAEPPAGWEVAFEPETVDQVPPGETAQVTAVITPSGEAVAGDYVVGMEAKAEAEQANSSADMRVTVRTSRLWGLVGIGLIGAAAAGLAWVFRRYGRR